MKIGMISDIHGNIQALIQVLEALDRQGADMILCAGDLVCYGANPNEVLQLLRQRNIPSVIGNYGAAVVWDLPSASSIPSSPQTEPLKQAALAWTKRNTSYKSIAYLRRLPWRLDYQIDGLRISVLHAGPDRLDESFSPDSPDRLEDLALRLQADVVVLGHTHQAYIHVCETNPVALGFFIPKSDECNWRGQTVFVNPGAVGRSLDGDTRASYAILDTATRAAHIYRTTYAVEAAVQAIAKSGMPAQIAALVRHGARRIEEIVA